MHWTVDAITDDVARLETGEGAPITVPRWLLPEGAREGDVLRVTLDRGCERATLALARDEAEAEARLARSAEQIAEAGRLTRGGGDIAL